MPIPEPIEPTTLGPLQRSSAVQRCCAARERSLEESRAVKLEKYYAQKAAAEAYCSAMPELSGYENIRDFIACTAHGLLNHSLDSIEGSKLLYAAQVAIGLLRQEPKTKPTPTPPTH